jgi:hypothetical protein
MNQASCFHGLKLIFYFDENEGNIYTQLRNDGKKKENRPRSNCEGEFYGCFKKSLF